MTERKKETQNEQYASLPVVRKASMVNNSPKVDENALRERIEGSFTIMDEILEEDLSVE